MVHGTTGDSKWEEEEEEDNIKMINPCRRNSDAADWQDVVVDVEGEGREEEVVEEAEEERLRKNEYLAKAAKLNAPPTIEGWVEIVGDSTHPVVYCNLTSGVVLYRKPEKWVHHMKNHYNNNQGSSDTFKKKKESAERMMSARLQ